MKILVFVLFKPSSSSTFIGKSKESLPLFTKIISSTKSPSFIKISFLTANIGLKHNITLTTKSILSKFLKKTKFLIKGLYISHTNAFFNVIGSEFIITFLSNFS